MKPISTLESSATSALLQNENHPLNALIESIFLIRHRISFESEPAKFQQRLNETKSQLSENHE